MIQEPNINTVSSPVVLQVGGFNSLAGIQAAMTYAVALGASRSNPYLLMVAPGTYTEDISLVAGVHLKANASPARSYATVLAGKVTADFGVVSGTLANYTTSMQGFRIDSQSGSYGIEFKGSYAQEVHFIDCQVYMGSAGKGVKFSNTGTDSGTKSIARLEGFKVWGAATNTNLPFDHSAGRIEWVGNNTVENASSYNSVAMAISGTAQQWSDGSNVSIYGQLTAASSDVVLLPQLGVKTLTASCIVTSMSNLFVVGLANLSAISASSNAAVSGAGIFIHSPSVLTFSNFATKVAATVNGGLGPFYPGYYIPSNTIQLTEGGTGATSASAARTALGVPATGAVTSSGLTMTNGKLAGRSSTGDGAIQEISVGTGLALSGGILSNTVTGGGGGGITYDKTSITTASLANGTYHDEQVTLAYVRGLIDYSRLEKLDGDNSSVSVRIYEGDPAGAGVLKVILVGSSYSGHMWMSETVLEGNQIEFSGNVVNCPISFKITDPWIRIKNEDYSTTASAIKLDMYTREIAEPAQEFL